MLIDLPELDTKVRIAHQNHFEELKTFFNSRRAYSAVVIISDSNVFPLFGSLLIEQLEILNVGAITCIVIDPGESSKNIHLAHICWERMHKEGIDRQALVIGLGGGVITDLAGFVAACYMRGLDVIHLPTSLMGMVDAALGGKSAINISSGKNIVGTMHQPKLVLILPHYLKSLPTREFIAGLAEVVKYGIIKDIEFFEMLENNTDAILDKNPIFINIVIQRCSQIKTDIVLRSEKEPGLRDILNLGHTFAHALEAATNYVTYLHGEAVSIGLSCAFYMSRCLGFIDDALLIRLHRLLKKLKLPLTLPDIPPPEVLIEHMYGDKKTVGGQLNLIIVKNIGHVEQFSNVSPQLILTAIHQKKEKNLE